jgi:multicomponent Na+:H+ antiporter subunit G
MGTCSILFGTFLIVGFTAAGIKALLCIVFLVLTAPVAAHAIARGAHRSGVPLWTGSVVDRYAEDHEGEIP